MLSKFRLPTLSRKPWPASSASSSKIEVSKLVEEENTPGYSADKFYPARLSEVFSARYQIATKLGYGSGSTVWLARDLNRFAWQDERYVALKINTAIKPATDASAKTELEILRLFGQTNTRHEGWHFVRKLVDCFTVNAANGSSHTCLVFEPLREPLWLYCRRFVGDVIPPNVLKIILRMVLEGLDYLHSDCRVIHADLKPDNILVKIEDHSILARDVLDEYNNPLPQKHTDGRVIYLSRNNYGQPSRATGVIQITDFDRSVLGNVPHTGCIQAEVYRAPEVILDAGYTFSADIWSLGVMLWDLLEGRMLFKQNSRHAGVDHDDQLHLAQITQLLGPAPEKLLNGQRASMFYGPGGSLNDTHSVPETFNFENTIRSMTGEEKQMFIEFARRMIKWAPEERSTARELLNDPWLYKDFT